MEELSSEILLPVFENLDSHQMIQIIRVCKRWQEIIDGNSRLWRRLVLPNRKPKRKNSLRILRSFDGKSKSGLREVSMQVTLESDEVESFQLLLEKSKESLRTLHLFSGVIDDQHALTELCWKLTNLSDCRIGYANDPRISFKQAEEDQVQDFRSSRHSSGFKVLWMPSFASLVKISKVSHRLDHLSSLRLEESVSPTMLIPILQRNSQTMKYLRVIPKEPMASETLPKVHLPHLEVLDTQHLMSTLLSWLIIPSSTIVIHRNGKLRLNLRPISRILFFEIPSQIQSLNYCQGLTEIRFLSAKNAKEFNGSFWSDLIATCRYCSNLHLKTLVIPFEHLNESQLLQLKELVEEVIDLETVGRRVEVEI